MISYDESGQTCLALGSDPVTTSIPREPDYAQSGIPSQYTFTVIDASAAHLSMAHYVVLHQNRLLYFHTTLPVRCITKCTLILTLQLACTG